jgi:predicted metal-binding membrane protein
MAGDMGATAMEPMESMGSMASMATDHVMSFGAFLLAWLAMMTAMMFPAIAPVVKLYARGAAAGRVAPLPFFVAGYIVVWTALGIPAFFAWRSLMDPIANGSTWAAVLAGGVLIAAGVWQLTPLKSICLRHCRSPMSVFLRFGLAASRPIGAVRMGATHGAYCVGCCWALMAVLVAVGTMNLAWMVGLAVLILLEKNAPWGERIARGAAIGMAVLGLLLIVRPETFAQVT